MTTYRLIDTDTREIIATGCASETEALSHTPYMPSDCLDGAESWNQVLEYAEQHADGIPGVVDGYTVEREIPDARTYAGVEYATPRQALAAAYLDFVTAGGSNDRQTALAAAQDQELESNLREAAEQGWQWPGEPERSDFLAAAAAARDELAEHLS